MEPQGCLNSGFIMLWFIMSFLLSLFPLYCALFSLCAVFSLCATYFSLYAMQFLLHIVSQLLSHAHITRQAVLPFVQFSLCEFSPCCSKFSFVNSIMYFVPYVVWLFLFMLHIFHYMWTFHVVVNLFHRVVCLGFQWIWF